MSPSLYALLVVEGYIVVMGAGLEDVDSGMSEAQAFAENFTPAREMHAIARKLQLGLDVDHGRWILPNGATA